MTSIAGNEGQEDADLLAELGQMISHVDPVPPELLATAEASLILHTIDADLAALTYDSAVDSGGMALVRGAPATRMLTFEAPGITVELEAVAVGTRRRLVGQLVPAQAGQVEVRHRGGVVPATADELGRFVTSDIEPGPVSLRCRVQGATDPVVVDTEWFLA
ncbi:MAG: hypothetical protein QOJ69_2082 [Actinomycetota bacterium]|jgi:hypothetical protein|nr:hypothetical protein [Actinomycetota bacterium]